MAGKEYRGRNKEGVWHFGYHYAVGKNHFITEGELDYIQGGYLGHSNYDDREELISELVDKDTVTIHVGNNRFGMCLYAGDIVHYANEPKTLYAIKNDVYGVFLQGKYINEKIEEEADLWNLDYVGTIWDNPELAKSISAEYNYLPDKVVIKEYTFNVEQVSTGVVCIKAKTEEEAHAIVIDMLQDGTVPFERTFANIQLEPEYRSTLFDYDEEYDDDDDFGIW